MGIGKLAIHTSVLREGHDKYYNNDITILQLLVDYIFRANFSDVERLFGDSDFLIVTALADNFEITEIKKIRETGTEFSVIVDLYRKEKKRKNRDDIIDGVLNN